ncbi:MAG: prolyl oligopeptidase family serine peptidase [Microbacteriaceae bacterium]
MTPSPELSPLEAADENLWLEEIHGEEQLAWVARQNSVTSAALDSPELDALAGRILEIIDSDDRIPLVSRRGNHLYNFWRDTEHPRGLWRRTTLDSYVAEVTEWDVLLDVDALGRDEETEWVFAGATVLPHTRDRALVQLSPDGGDAVVVREFSLTTRSFVADGFVLPLAKSRVSWIDRDTLFVATDFGPGSLTTSSYPRSVRRWSRGTALEHATVVREIDASEMSIAGVHDFATGFERDLIVESIDFYRERVFVITDGELVRIETPEDADVDAHHEWLLVQPRSPWLGFAVGSLLAIRFDDFMAGSRSFAVIFEPTASVSLQGWDWTASRLILTLLDDVSSRLDVLDPCDWSSITLEVPELSAAHILDTSPDDGGENADEYWLHLSGFLTPPSVLRGVLGGPPAVVVKRTPSFFDESRFEVTQHFAVSVDGTRVPYFQVAARGIPLDGSHRTLLSGYGGFQAARLPEYSGTIGRAWLERGGVFVLANIRGGGEYGPAWHTSALRSSRPRAYEDFAAIARDLVARGVTVPERLACEGRSNGGLLVGNMLVSYPDLFGAVICGVPLLDMRRYTKLSAGASWIAEYGDPDVAEDWEFMQQWSPYHLLSASTSYPDTFLYAATSDDRVGPVQARKMAARMQRLEIPGVLYYEPADGGHGGAVDNSASARLFAYMYGFAWDRLSSPSDQ